MKQKNNSPAACEGLNTKVSMLKKYAGSSAASHLSFILNDFLKFLNV